MTRTIEKALAEIAHLPAKDQEKIGRGLLSHIEKLRRPRAEIDKGVQSLDADRRGPLDIDAFISRMRLQYGEA